MNKGDKLVKIYRENAYGNKQLDYYIYKGHKIEIDYIDTRSYYNPFRKDGYIVPDLKEVLGYSFIETLKEAKELIDKYLGGK